MPDPGLIGPGVATRLVNGAENRGRVEMLHERARAVVDGLARDGHIVGVHHAVDEASPIHCAMSFAALHDMLEQADATGLPHQQRRVAGDGVLGQPCQQACRPRRAPQLKLPTRG